ncbi:hypothetical protein GCM10023195_27070 [Actinoallomurus liliacearum]|uniref:Uncharacterized protein n=1 Tax=Actinoallomurus liliacearum TaxID=1080073 RepID=A0ABP8TL74_9ACTN
MTPEERLMRSLPGLRALVDSLAAHSPSEARALLHPDSLVRKYPAAARMSLQRRQRADTDQLRYLAVALRRFDEMTAEEFHAYLRG